MVLQELREHKQGWSWSDHNTQSLLLLSLLFNQNFKEKKWVQHDREIMPEFPSFAELERSRKPQKGKRWPQICNFQIPFECLVGMARTQAPMTWALVLLLQWPGGWEPAWDNESHWPEFWGKPEQGQTLEKFCSLPSECALLGSLGIDYILPLSSKNFAVVVCLRWHRGSWCQCHTPPGSLVTPCPALILGCLANENHQPQEPLIKSCTLSKYLISAEMSLFV